VQVYYHRRYYGVRRTKHAHEKIHTRTQSVIMVQLSLCTLRRKVHMGKWSYTYTIL